jgi:cytosine/adenosine deaminase-related metal-dependent hydrolase
MIAPTPRAIDCAYIIAGANQPVSARQTIHIDGATIKAVTGGISGVPERSLLALPALVNAHDHGRAVRTSSIGAGGRPLESWLPLLALFPSVNPYLAAVVALSNAALGGAGAVMVHYTRVQGFTNLPTEATEVARAARDVGVRAGFAVAVRDRNPVVYGPSEPFLSTLPEATRAEVERRFLRTPLTPQQYLALVDEVAAAADGPMFNVQYGPQAVQWCSDALLEAIAGASAANGRRIHMHFLETRYQRAWADANYPGGIVPHLDSLGLLSPRLSLIHCVWARPDELDLLAARGVTIVNNNSSNLHLRSGMAPVARMLERGCRLAIGIDGNALDEDDDSLREFRLAHLLHVGTGFKVSTNREQVLGMAFANGRLSVTNVDDGGVIAAGAPADLLLLDWAALDNDKLREDADVLGILFARATARHIHELIVAGRTVIRDGRVLGVDLAAARAEIIAQMRAGVRDSAAFAATLPALEMALAAHFEPECC